MKKSVSLIMAAVFIFAVAGCTNKKADSGTAESAAESVSSEVHHTVVTDGKPTKRPMITTVTERETSPNHLTERPTTTQRTTITVTVPERTTRPPRTTVTRTAVQKTTRTTAPVQATTAPDTPSFVYGGTFSQGTAGDSVRLVSHTCTPTDRETFSILLTFEILEKSGTREHLRVGYNCYDKGGKKLNSQLLYCIVPLSAPGEKVSAVATATFGTARIEFVNYKT